MNRVLLAVLIGVAVISLLCVGLAAVVVFSPLRAQLAGAFDRFASRVDLPFGQRDEIPQYPEPLRANPFQLEQQAEEGILVSGVLPDSPAEAAGLQRGDIVLQAGGQPVNTMVGLFAVLSEREAGDEIELLVQRGDEQITLTAVVDEPSNGRPERVFRQAMPLGIIPGDNFGFHMIPEIPLNESTGVRITEVVANSPAGRAGLEEGEVILAVNGEPVRFNGDLTRPIQQSRPGDELTLTVQDANGDSREVTVTLGEDPSPEREGRAWLGISITPLRDKIDPGIPLPGVPSLPDGDQEDPIVPPRMVLPQFPEGYQTGALIQEVITGSPAEEASLEAGVLILEVNGETLETETDLADAIGALEPGDRVTLTVSEPADTLDNLTAPRVEEVEVTLGENPDESGAAYLGIRFSFVRMRMEREEVPGVPGAPGALLPQPVPGT